MRKNYVLDTNVLLHDPKAIFRFEDNHVVIPIFVIEEIDQFKREASERGRNARQITRLLDELRERGALSTGVSLDGGGRLTVAVPANRPELPSAIDKTAMDAAILQTAFEVRGADPASPTIFVTMDTNLRIRADALGLPAETYENQRVDVDDALEPGLRDVEVDGEAVDAFFRDGQVSMTLDHVRPNGGVVLHDRTNPNHTALGRYDAAKKAVVALRVPRDGVMGLRPRNKEQAFALDILLDDSIRIVTLAGKAGTGKTLLALAAGLKRCVEDGHYTRVLVSRPVMPLGRDIGFLPGDVDDKLNPWMQPIFDNLEMIFSAGSKKGSRAYADLIASGQVQVEPLTYIRGRSLPQQYIIVDEAQNLTPHEVKTIITRAGDGTKIVLTGDTNQIDNPFLDAASNGLSVVADRFRGQHLAGHIVLSKGERSELAELAANLL
jgi:PhoH-like ATPase